jgi:hypothetical protein
MPSPATSCGVADQHLARPGTEDAGGQHVADPAGLRDPAAPRPDQPPAPLLLDDPGDRCGGVHRPPAEGVAVEVEQPVVDAGEARPEAGQRIRVVLCDRGGVDSSRAAMLP